MRIYMDKRGCNECAFSEKDFWFWICQACSETDQKQHLPPNLRTILMLSAYKLPWLRMRPEWIQCNASTSAGQMGECNSSLASTLDSLLCHQGCVWFWALTYPHSIDEGAERLILPIRILLHQALQSFKSSLPAYAQVIIQSRDSNQWSVQGKCQNIHPSLSGTQKEPNEHLPAFLLPLVRSFISRTDVWEAEGKEVSPSSSPLNQRLRQLIYSALEGVRVLLVENVLGTYKIYSNAINIIP